jgi:CRP-like cAMP-binding protein
MKRRTFKAGEVIIKKGSVAQALFILSSGVLIALRTKTLELGDGEEEAMRLAPGDCFGLSGLLTGSEALYDIKSLTKAVVYELSKEDLTPTLTERPAIASEISLILAQREAVEKARLQGLNHQDKQSDNLTARLAERIKNIFGLA